MAEERSALHAYNYLDEQHHAGPIHHTYQLSSHESTIESLSQAATYWFNVVCALEAHLEYGPVDEEDTASEHDLQAPIGHVLEQRERVWSIGLAVLQEQVQALAWSSSIEKIGRAHV